MASGANMVELKTQEIVFLGNMFVDPKEMNQYGSVIETHELISTEPAKSIWKKMYAHYTKYGELPPDELMDNVFSDKELENLRLGIAIAGSEASRAMFILDQFIGTMHTMLYKRFMASLEKMFDSGNTDIDNANDLMKKLSEDLLTIRHLSGASVQSMGSIWESWSKGELMTQAPRIPIPIKGLEFVQGTPPSAVNVLIGHYGGGKTSTLCAMASQLSTTCNVLYVTLEMPAESIAFRILACQSQGKIQANHVFMNPNTWGDNEVQPVIKKAKEVINGEHSIYFIDAPATTASPAQLDVYLKNFKNRYGLDVDVVIIDYAALMVTNSGASREDIGWGYTGVIIKELTAVAKKHGLVIWVAAQAGGESAHTVTSANSSSFKPLRGNQLYGSKEVLQDASYVLGLSFMRSSEFPHLAVGVLSTIKNRYGSEFYDYICSMDYSTASFESLGIAPGGSEGDLISLVEQHLRSMEQEFAVKNQLQNKQKVQSLKSLYYNANKSATSCGTAGLVKPKAPKPSYLQKPKASSKQQDSREESY